MPDTNLLITHEELNKIPKKVYKNIDSKYNNIIKHDECCICMLKYCENDNVRILLCGHIFHNDCIVSWLLEHSNKCPYCRKNSIKNNLTILKYCYDTIQIILQRGQF
jgi:hypothetical protein